MRKVEEALPQPIVIGAGALAVLRELAQGEQCVSALVERTGLSQPNVSNHLSRLRAHGVVQCRREGRLILYRLLPSVGGAGALSHAVAAARPSSDIDEVAHKFRDALSAQRPEEARRWIEIAIASRLGWRRIYLEILAPALVHVGRLWEAGAITVAEEHQATQLAIQLLHGLSLRIEANLSADAPAALVACVEGELHTVGGQFVTDFLRSKGWRATFLGNHLPGEHLVAALERLRPDAVVLCISVEQNEPGLHRALECLHGWRGGSVRPLVVAGGAYFRDARAPVGADLVGSDVEAVTDQMIARVCAAPARTL